MRLYLDMEFTGLHKATTPISLALFSDQQDFFYGVFTDYDTTQVDDWLRKNVLAQLNPHWPSPMSAIFDSLVSPGSFYTTGNDIFIVGTKAQIKDRLGIWIEKYQKKSRADQFQVWADVGHYDKVLFDDVFGGAFNLPKQLNYIFHDVATLLLLEGIDPDINRSEFIRQFDPEFNQHGCTHNALHDARATQKIVSHLLRQRTWRAKNERDTFRELMDLKSEHEGLEP